MNSACSRVHERGANSFYVLRRPHLGYGMPRVLFASAVKVSPNDFQHFDLHRSQFVQLLCRTWRSDTPQSAIARFEILHILQANPGAYFGNFIVEIGLEIGAYILQLVARKPKNYSRRKL